MSESNKTLAYLVVACAACLAAYVSQPNTTNFDAEDEVGKPLTKEFATEDAKRMKITRFDEDSATLDSFEVAQVGRLWTIPSKGGYPADAEEQMAAAVDGVRGREILSVASKTAQDHKQYGVLDPESPKLQPGDTGVGARVTIEDESGDALVDLIIGEAVKDSEGLHYVRRANQDFVYVAKISPEDLSTTFEDWIEDDLLKISPWDILQVRLNDYSASLVLAGGGLAIDPEFRSDITIEYDDAESKWRPVSLKAAAAPRSGQYEEFSLADDEELNDDALRELKNALDDLKIVDVAKKPAGLSADLKAGEDFRKDLETVLSLVERGFAPMDTGDLISTSGEVVCTMKDGVEYVLRFGDPQLDGMAEEKKQGDEGPESQQGLNRYMFVMARMNQGVIQKPELEDVPDLPAGVAEEDAVSQTGEEELLEEETPQEEDPADTADEQAEQETDEPSTEELIEQRKEVEQRNQRKLDDYADEIKQAKEKVAALNDRFGDWYYVVPGAEFNKLRLGRDDVIKKKEPAEGEAEDAKTDAGPLGAPGSAIPGMPDLGGIEIAPMGDSAEGPAGEEPVDQDPAVSEEASLNEAE